MNDVNLLMSRIESINAEPNPRNLSKSDIDTLIAYHRHNRARRLAGDRPAKPAAPSVDLSALLNLPASKGPAPGSTIPTITRRV
jgi:hypothetical protein